MSFNLNNVQFVISIRACPIHFYNKIGISSTVDHEVDGRSRPEDTVTRTLSVERDRTVMQHPIIYSHIVAARQKTPRTHCAIF